MPRGGGRKYTEKASPRSTLSPKVITRPAAPQERLRLADSARRPRWGDEEWLSLVTASPKSCFVVLG
jgi:hypothetical protein